MIVRKASDRTVVVLEPFEAIELFSIAKKYRDTSRILLRLSDDLGQELGG